MAASKKTDQYGKRETKRRMDAALRVALNTPPKPQSQISGKNGKSPATKAAKSA